jgi:leucyl-tRNA synthetase
MWEKVGGKECLSLSPWPSFDAAKIDERVEAGEELIHEMADDIASVKKLAGIENPSKVTLFVAELWKYQFISRLKGMLDVTNNPGEIIKEFMKDEEMKKHGKEIAKLVPSYVKNRSKLPLILLSQKDEMDILCAAQPKLADTAGTDVEITDQLDHPKAKQAMPGRPAIVVEK